MISQLVGVKGKIIREREREIDDDALPNAHVDLHWFVAVCPCFG